MCGEESHREIKIKQNTFWAGLAEPILLIVIDYLVVMLAVLTAYQLRQQLTPLIGMEFYVHAPYIYFRIPILFVFFLHTNRGSLLGQPFWKTMRQTFWNVFYGMAGLIVLMYFGHVANNVSRLFLGFTGIFVFIYITAGRYLCKKILERIRLFQMPVLFVGAGLTAERVLESFRDDVGFGYRIIGFVDDNPASTKIAAKYRILGGFDDADRIVRLLGVKHVIITAPGLEQQRLVRLISSIQPYVRNVAFVPDIIGAPGNLEIVSLADAGIMLINVKNNLAKWYNRAIKRIFDIVLCLLGMIVFIPLTVVIGIAIYIDNPGPIFFTGKRLGRNGTEFKCYKFRSMFVNADSILEDYFTHNKQAEAEWKEFAKIKGDDPRVTKVGKFLRKYSLDELPQLINVIKGEMSLVGPRPYLPREKEDIGEEFSTICLTVPGITGLWQTSGRNEIKFKGRVAMDSWYVHNWSVWLDIAYLWKTISVVLNRKGAY